MKRIYLVLTALSVSAIIYGQNENKVSNTDSSKGTDTLKVGNFIIIRKGRDNSNSQQSENPISKVVNIKRHSPGRISTNWWIFDLGLANVTDETNYNSAEAQNFLRPMGMATKPGVDDLKLKAAKTSNVNIWVFMQRLNLAKGYINLKYGLGLEMFNFRYESNIRYNKTPNFIYKDSIALSKNKLYAGYATVPFMLNINTTPGRKKGLSLSAGLSAGYLVGSRTKEVSKERGKEKTKGDIGLEKLRLAYIGELGIGPVRIFGSYSIRKLHELGLVQYPYSVGIRFSNW